MNLLTDFAPLFAMAAMVKAIIDFLKYARAADTNGMVTSVAAWVAGVVVMILAAQSDFAEGIVVGDRVLSDLNIYSLIFIGFTVGTAAQAGVEAIKAVDQSRSSAKPRLVDGTRT